MDGPVMRAWGIWHAWAHRRMGLFYNSRPVWASGSGARAIFFLFFFRRGYKYFRRVGVQLFFVDNGRCVTGVACTFLLVCEEAKAGRLPLFVCVNAGAYGGIGRRSIAGERGGGCGRRIGWRGAQRPKPRGSAAARRRSTGWSGKAAVGEGRRRRRRRKGPLIERRRKRRAWQGEGWTRRPKGVGRRRGRRG